MKEDIMYQEEIINYIEDTLSSEEKRAFEDRMANDADLNNEVKEYRALILGIANWGDQAARTTIGNIDKQLENNGFFNENEETTETLTISTMQWWWKNYLKVAAVAIGLLAGSSFIYNYYVLKENVQVFANNFLAESDQLPNIIEKYSPKGIVPVESNNQDTLMMGLKAFQKGEYSKTIEYFNNWKSNEENQSVVNFYLALSLLSQNEDVKSAKILDKLRQDPGFELNNSAKWYYGLALLKQKNKRDQAIKIFNELAKSTDNLMASKARKILNEL